MPPYAIDWRRRIQTSLECRQHGVQPTSSWRAVDRRHERCGVNRHSILATHPAARDAHGVRVLKLRLCVNRLLDVSEQAANPAADFSYGAEVGLVRHACLRRVGNDAFALVFLH